MASSSGLTKADLLERNKDYASTTHKAVPDLLTIFRGSFKLNAPNFLIISCLDSRSNPYNYLQIKPSEAIVLRNVGGRVKGALSDILALDTQFGLNQIIIVQHTNCGSSHLKEGDVLEHVKATTEDAANAEAWEKAVVSYVATHTEQCIKDDLALLKQQPQIRKELTDGAIGFWLDVQTGLLKEVEA